MWVATTRLALALAAGGAGQAKRDGNEGFIVVETNYRVSSLHVAVRCLCLKQGQAPACILGDRMCQHSPSSLVCMQPYDQLCLQVSDCNKS